MKNNRIQTKINAGSMADIAFLLLIFFLTTTSIYNDKGITTTLPKFYDGPPGGVSEKNVGVIRINSESQVLFEKNEIKVDMIKDAVINFVLNPNKSAQWPSKPQDAIISIQNDPELSYKVYMKVYAEIKSAYQDIYDQYSQNLFGNSFNSLPIKNQNEVRKLLPIKISEAEYTFRH